MAVGAIAGIAAPIIGGLLGGKGASDAADAQAQASQQATQAQLSMYNQTRADQSPYRYVGGQALNSLAAQMGLNPYGDQGNAMTGYGGGYGMGANMLGTGASGMPYLGNALARGGRGNAQFPGQQPGKVGSFMTSPSYNFVRNEGLRGIQQSAAARGGAFSGNALRELNQFNSGLASQEYGNWWNRMAGLAGIGQTSTNQLGALGADYAGQIGRNTLMGGDARASGIMGQYNSIANGINSGISNYLWQRNSNNQYNNYLDSVLTPVNVTAQRM